MRCASAWKEQTPLLLLGEEVLNSSAVGREILSAVAMQKICISPRRVWWKAQPLGWNTLKEASFWIGKNKLAFRTLFVKYVQMINLGNFTVSEASKHDLKVKFNQCRALVQSFWRAGPGWLETKSWQIARYKKWARVSLWWRSEAWAELKEKKAILVYTSWANGSQIVGLMDSSSFMENGNILHNK